MPSASMKRLERVRRAIARARATHLCRSYRQRALCGASPRTARLVRLTAPTAIERATCPECVRIASDSEGF